MILRWWRSTARNEAFSGTSTAAVVGSIDGVVGGVVGWVIALT
jgi:hypothetical protein